MSDQLDKLLIQRDKVQKKIEIENFKIKQSQYSENRKERKKRTRRLIQKGALLDKYFNTEHLNADDTENLLRMFSDYVIANTPEKYKKG